MSGEGCGCPWCRVERGEIPPGPYTPAEFAALGLQRGMAASTPALTGADDPAVIAAATAVDKAREEFAPLDEAWREATARVRDADLLTRSQDRATAERARRALLGLREAVQTASDERDAAWKLVVKAQGRYQREARRALLAALTADQPAPVVVEEEPVRRAPVAFVRH